MLRSWFREARNQHRQHTQQHAHWWIDMWTISNTLCSTQTNCCTVQLNIVSVTPTTQCCKCQHNFMGINWLMLELNTAKEFILAINHHNSWNLLVCNGEKQIIDKQMFLYSSLLGYRTGQDMDTLYPNKLQKHMIHWIQRTHSLCNNKMIKVVDTVPTSATLYSTIAMRCTNVTPVWGHYRYVLQVGIS